MVFNKNVKTVKGLFVLQLIIFLIMIVFCKNIYATGWEYINGDWYYMDRNNEAYANCFVDRGQDKYFVGDNGKIVRDKFFEWSDAYYYAGPDGKLAQNEFKDISYSALADLGLEEGIYYFGNNYKCYRKTGSTFRKMIEGCYYAFDENGKVITGWMDVDGNYIDSESQWLTDGMYYSDEYGVMYINRWMDFAQDIGVHYIDNNETELGSTEYNYLGKMWMYFNSDGKKIKPDSTDGERRRKINDVEYAFDENGVMITYFSKTGGLDYTQASNPTSFKAAKMYGDENDGSLNIDKWLWLFPAKELDEKEYNAQDMHWWHTDKDGKLITNRLKEIDGKKYAFDGIGRLKAGFVFFSGGRTYVANYMPEDMTREDFLYSYDSGSRLYGHELADLRYFGDDDKLDGSMKTGEIQIELSDGTWTFCFGKNGIAYGNKNKVRKIKNVYYINGLKLTPLEDRKSGIVKAADNEYRVVGPNGKIKKASRRVLKDDDGNYMLMMNNEIVGYKLASCMPDVSTDVRWYRGDSTRPAGFYYYDTDTKSGEDKYHYGICLNPSVTTSLSSADVADLPDDMRVNFK